MDDKENKNTNKILKYFILYFAKKKKKKKKEILWWKWRKSRGKSFTCSFLLPFLFTIADSSDHYYSFSSTSSAHGFSSLLIIFVSLSSSPNIFPKGVTLFPLLNSFVGIYHSLFDKSYVSFHKLPIGFSS